MTIVSKTKTQIPQFSQDYLPRPRLVEAGKTAVFHHLLTLISAPAGAGKTTLATSILLAANPAYQAWLRLDPGDNDPQTLVTALVQALQTAVPTLGTTALQLIQNAPDPAQVLQPALTLLVNDLHETAVEPLLLVLDDYHTIDNTAVHQAVEYWLTQLPPTVHLLLTTRFDPPLALARLRMRGQLAEFRLQELCFSLAETETYLQKQQSIQLSPEQLAQLQNRTDGWIAGLRLLAMTLGKLDNPAEQDAFITQFSRSNRLVFDLLAEEVLAHQPPSLRDFLVQTAVLDELTPELCTAVTQNPAAPQLLTEAYKRNLFLTATDPFASAATAYRYHDLFASLLRRKLHEQGEAAFRAAHQRAAAAQPDPVQAIEHFLQAQDWDGAVAGIEAQSIPQLRRRHINQRTLDWIGQLPQAVVAGNNWMRLVTTYHQAQVGNMSKAVIQELMAIRDAFGAYGDKQGEYLTLLAAVQASGGYDATILGECRRFFHENPEIVRPEDEIALLLSAAWGAEDRDNWPLFNDYFGQLLKMLMQMPWLHYVVGQGFGAPFLFSDLGLAPIEKLIEQMKSVHGEGKQLIHLGIYSQGAAIDFYKGRLDEALRNGRIARRIIKQLGNLAWQESNPNFVELNTHLAQGNYAALYRFCEEQMPRAAADPSIAFSVLGFQYALALAYWHQGKTEALGALVQELAEKYQFTESPAPGQELPRKVTQLAYKPMEGAVLLILGWGALAQQEFATAQHYFEDAAALQAVYRHTFLGGHPRLALACLHWLWHEHTGEPQQLREAEHQMTLLLAETAAREMPGLLLQAGRVAIPLLRHVLPRSPHADLIRVALDAFGEPDEFRPLPIPNSEECLTPREVEVLHLLVAGASNRQIAEALVVTTRTAKAHVSSILQKLGVSTRAQAMAAARDLSLL
ncbi:MAG: hypothetical protein IT327_20770 [Anaerolineae bacterium]|nr:hypothetical protein [Anaerolineae bacterium]